MYKIPNEYFFRIHHVRPRFKNDVENVLLYMANVCENTPQATIAEYKQQLFNAIRLYPGNEIRADKTINNWRTEIAALFGFYVEDKSTNLTKTGKISNLLNANEDLVQFFKYFLLKFQYPGGHIKSDYVKKIIDSGVKFKPAQYILSVLHQADGLLGKPLGISKAEATHCIFNDLRVTRDNRAVSEVITLIVNNRNWKAEYDSTGDVIRYAGDILDYMVLANLLKESHGYYYINRLENEAILAIINSKEYFTDYDKFYGKEITTTELTAVEKSWFEYANSNLSESVFRTDILTYITPDIESADTEDSYRILVEDKIANVLESSTTKDIGDLGETLIIGHEKVRVRDAGREDLLHLIRKIPTNFAVGYDIQSVEEDARKRYIEVKTTISNKPLHFYSFHMTPNEWDTASSLKDRYFVYRLMISKTAKTILILQDPVGLYKDNQLNMTPRNGVEINFNHSICEKTELMIWKN